MSEKKLTLLWAASLIAGAAASLTIIISLLVDFELSQTVIRIAGIVDLAAIAVLFVTTAKKMQKK